MQGPHHEEVCRNALKATSRLEKTGDSLGGVESQNRRRGWDSILLHDMSIRAFDTAPISSEYRGVRCSVGFKKESISTEEKACPVSSVSVVSSESQPALPAFCCSYSPFKSSVVPSWGNPGSPLPAGGHSQMMRAAALTLPELGKRHAELRLVWHPFWHPA